MIIVLIDDGADSIIPINGSTTTRFKDLHFAPREFPVTYSEKLKNIAQEFKPR
jgi:hypothetical protein